MKERIRAVAGILLAALLVAGAGLLSPRAEANRESRNEVFYYPSRAFLRDAVLGYRQAAASLTWLRAVQYYGEHKRGDQEFEMMYHLCDIVTDLDPRFLEPYLFGSLVIFTEGDHPEEGLQLLAKGRENNPDAWSVFFETGFALYVFGKDHEAAAEYFIRAASMKDAPEKTRRFAAFVTEKAGELETSLLLWQDLAASSANEELRARAEVHIQEVLAQIAQRDGTSPR